MYKIFSFLVGLFFFVGTTVSAHDHEGMGMGKSGHFKKMDANGDNKVSKEEWQKFHDTHFTELDKDADGSVTMDEMKAFLEQKKSEKEEKKEDKKEAKEAKKQAKKEEKSSSKK